MNKDQIAGEWKSIKGKIKEKWGKLTDDEITQINGKREQLVGKLQSKYGYAKEKAEQEIKDFETHLVTADRSMEREFRSERSGEKSTDRTSTDRTSSPRNERPNPRDTQGPRNDRPNQQRDTQGRNDKNR